MQKKGIWDAVKTVMWDCVWVVKERGIRKEIDINWHLASY